MSGSSCGLEGWRPAPLARLLSPVRGLLSVGEGVGDWLPVLWVGMAYGGVFM